MRLSWSGEHTGEEFNLDAIVNADDHGGNVQHGKALNDFAESVMAGDVRNIAVHRDNVSRAVGAAGMADAAGVIAAFNLVARVADSTGLPLEDYKEEASVDLRERLGLNDFRSA
jgi:hypothetical protein